MDKGKKEKSYESDIAEFTGWLLDAVRQVITELEAGMYNEKVQRELPPELKTGTIVRKGYFYAFPEKREIFRDGLTDSEAVDERTSTFDDFK